MTHRQLIPLPISLHSRCAVMLLLLCFERLSHRSQGVRACACLDTCVCVRIPFVPMEMRFMILERMTLLDLHRIYDRPGTRHALRS